MKRSTFLALSFLFVNQAYALVACTYPATCTPPPGHGNSCNYSTCTQNSSGSVTFKLVSLAPVNIPSDACAIPSVTDTARIPTTIAGVTIDHVPITVTIPYSTCVDGTITNP